MLQLKSVTSQDIELRSNDEVVIINQGFLKYYLENYDGIKNTLITEYKNRKLEKGLYKS